MTNDIINYNLKRHEHNGEKIITNIRLLLAIIYTISTTAVAIIKSIEGTGYIPIRSHVITIIFLFYSIFLFIYVRKINILHNLFKYFCVILDMFILSASIWISCTYVEISPPLPFFSSRVLFFSILILAGSFRQSTLCAYFSGILAAFCFLIIVIINRNVLDLPYFFEINNKIINVRFPFYNELFKFFGMIIIGWITGMASKLNLELLKNMIITKSDAVDTANATFEQSKIMAQTIQKSTDDIFYSSKDIFSTANNQAASIQEIESTIKENTKIAVEIADKTASVATIAVKMESDVLNGFCVLENNVEQLKNIKNKNDRVITGIIALGNKILKIRDIVKNINKITDQTKVIAFNTALEAASAGEKGKRFAVVASEVNRLADDISILTKQIREQVEEIQNSSSTLIISSEESADNIIQGNNLIKKLEEIFREIRSGAEITSNQAQIITISTHKQLNSSEQINTAIADISKGLTNFIQSTKITTSSAENLTKLTHELGSLLTNNINNENSDSQGSN